MTLLLKVRFLYCKRRQSVLLYVWLINYQPSNHDRRKIFGKEREEKNMAITLKDVRIYPADTTAKAVSLAYLYTLRKIGAESLAIECEFPAGIYHMAMYHLSDVITFFENLESAEFKRIFRMKDGFRLRPLTIGEPVKGKKPRNKPMQDFVHVVSAEFSYTQEGRMKFREFEQKTRKIHGGYDLTGLTNSKIDLKLIDGWGMTECKAMSGMLCFGDEIVTDI